MKDSAPILHYCQKCLAANPLGQDFCERCGTRLMIVVEPSALRYEAGESGISTDEHLLERISAAENRISRLQERLERCLDLLLRNAQNSYFDRSLLKSLIGVLSEDGLVKTDRLEDLWNATCQSDVEEQQESIKRDELRSEILSRMAGTIRSEFEALVNEGFLLLDDNQTDRGFEVLRRAAEVGKSNSSLALFIGEHFFRKGKTKLAREYLSRAYEQKPDNVRLSLLLGLTCADDGDPELAMRLLSNVMERGVESFAVHYGLGRLFLAENDWKKALREFKQALVNRPSPEAHYVLACLYYQLERDTLAERHLRKAINMDKNYREAIHLLSLIHGRRSDIASSPESLGKTVSRRAAGPNQRVATTRTAQPVAPLFDIRAGSRRIMTGTDKRLARALREDALRET